jgi:hypothetical protein
MQHGISGQSKGPSSVDFFVAEEIILKINFACKLAKGKREGKANTHVIRHLNSFANFVLWLQTGGRLVKSIGKEDEFFSSRFGQ